MPSTIAGPADGHAAYDVKRVVDKFRADVLVPAGLPDLAIWATEYEPAPFPALPT